MPINKSVKLRAILKSLVHMKVVIFNYTKEHFIGHLFSVFFGSLTTIALFFYTANPISSSEIKGRLETLLLEKLRDDSNIDADAIEFNSVISQSLDLSQISSTFIYATVSRGDEIYRVLGVFEPQEQTILDRLVGRSSFYHLASFSLISVPYSNSLLPENIEIEDYDLDGNKEIIIRVKSVFADSSSTGMIFLKKNEDEVWNFLGFPSLSKKLSEGINGKLPHPESLQPASKPAIWFGGTESSEVKIEDIKKAYTNYSVYEDEWDVLHNGLNRTFFTIRNGIKIEMKKHPLDNHIQFGIAANVADDNAVQGSHHIFITFFVIGKTNIETDLNWNWGFPMLSVEPEKLSGINIDEFHEVGISAHIENETFFGYTEFERIPSM